MARTELDRFWAKVSPEPNSGCWLWTGALLSPNGYGVFRLSVGKNMTAHRYSCELAHGTPEEGECALHKCDVKSCVNPDHLYWGSVKDNTRDAIERGQWAIAGEAHHMAVLTDATAMEVFVSNAPPRLLAPQYGVSEAAIRAVKTRRTWRHIHVAQ